MTYQPELEDAVDAERKEKRWKTHVLSLVGRRDCAARARTEGVGYLVRVIVYKDVPSTDTDYRGQRSDGGLSLHATYQMRAPRPGRSVDGLSSIGIRTIFAWKLLYSRR